MSPERSVTYVSERTKGLSSRLATVSVRSQSALTKRAERPLRSRMMPKNLHRCDPSAVRFQSALVCRVSENRGEHFSCCMTGSSSENLGKAIQDLGGLM